MSSSGNADAKSIPTPTEELVKGVQNADVFKGSPLVAADGKSLTEGGALLLKTVKRGKTQPVLVWSNIIALLLIFILAIVLFMKRGNTK